MKAGQRDRRLTLLRNTQVRDAFNALTDQWAEIGIVWAGKLDVSDGERWRAAEVSAQITTRFRVLQSSLTRSLTPKDRLRCQGRSYDIQGIKEIGREGFEITANARADQEAVQ